MADEHISATTAPGVTPPTDDDGLRFGVLGPLEVRHGGRLVPLRRARERTLLGLLLLRHNRVVAVSTLVEGLWGAAPPPTAARTLQSHVSRLRRLLEPDRRPTGSSVLVTMASGYCLRVRPESVDAALFEQLAARGRRALSAGAPELALARLQRALALWRGEAFEDLADGEFALAERDRLGELQLTAISNRIDAELALDHGAPLVGELQRLVTERPMQERLWGQLMVALYESGRQVEALETYRTARARLVEEVGVEPGPWLRSLEAAVLAQPPRLVPPDAIRSPGLPPVLRADTTPVVGRDEELRWLELAWQRALDDAAEVVVVQAGPGMGASRLVAEFARVVDSRGAAVLLGPVNTEMFVATAVERPVLVVLDDPSGVDLGEAERLVGATARLPVLILATTHSVGKEAEHPALRVAEERILRMGPLGVEQVAAIVASYVSVSGKEGASGKEGVDGKELMQAAEAVCTSSGGVPARVHEHAAAWADGRAGERVGQHATRVAAGRRDLVAVEHEMVADILDLQRARTRRRVITPATAGGGVVADRPVVCPYKGLARFDEQDAAYFFGRERLVAHLVSRCVSAPLLAVVGPSGSGKSSVVRAGLVPAIRSGILPGSERWRIRLLRAGALAAVPADIGFPPDPSLRSGSAGSPAVEPDGNELLVFDQFEEAFTTWTEESRYVSFDRLVGAVERSDGRLRVVLTVRTDYYDGFSRHPALARLVSDNTVLVGPMRPEELRQVIEGPARLAGLDLEDGFADAVLAQVRQEPGTLPLLSTALLETWERRAGRTLSVAAYREAGGVAGALTRLAEGVYEGLDAAGQAIVRRVFLRLADPGERSDDLRRRAPRSELAGSEQVEAVLTTLIQRRLVIAADDTVEVAHEALLREWPRLRGWLEEDRDGRHVHRHLSGAAEAWDAGGRDPADLYRGPRLTGAQDWAAAHPGDANPLEEAFLAASTAAQERTLHTARRTTRRLRSLASGLAALLVVALIATGLAVAQRYEATEAAALARAEARAAQAGRLATLARSLDRDQIDLALLLGVESYRLHPSIETEGGLATALVHTPPGLEQVIRFGAPSLIPVTSPSASRDGRLLAVPAQDGTVALLDTQTGRVQRTLRWDTPRHIAIFSTDTRLLAVGGSDGTVVVFDVATGRLAGAPIPAGGNLAYGQFDPTDPSRLFTSNDRGEIVFWDRSVPQAPRRVGQPLRFDAPPRSIPIVVINRDGTRLAAGTYPGTSTRVWDVTSGTVLRDLPGVSGYFGPDGVTLPTARGDRVALWNVDTGREQGPPLTGFTAASPGMLLSPDGRRIAVNDKGIFVRVFDLASRQEIGAFALEEKRAGIPTMFLPDGRLVISGNGEAGIWQLDRTTPPLGVILRGHRGHVVGTFVPGSNEIVTYGIDDDQLLRWDAATGGTRGRLLDGAVRAPVAFSPDGALLAATRAHDDTVALWDRTRNTELAVLGGTRGGARSHVAWSPTGRQIATASDGSVQVWDVTDPHHPVSRMRLNPDAAPHPGTPDRQYLYFSHDGRRLAVEDIPDRTITVFDAATGHEQWSTPLPATGSGAVAFSPDDTTLAIGIGTATAGQVTLRDAATGAPMQTLQTPSSGGVEFLRGGRVVMTTRSSAEASAAQLWDAATLTPIGEPLPQPDGGAYSISRNAAGTTAVAGSSDGFAVIWDLDITRWEASACRIAGRNLTQDEWRQYLPNQKYQLTCPQWPAGK